MDLPSLVVSFDVGPLRFIDRRRLSVEQKETVNNITIEAFAELMKSLGREDYMEVCQSGDVYDRHDVKTLYLDALKLDPNLDFGSFARSLDLPLQDWEENQKEYWTGLVCTHIATKTCLGSLVLFNARVLRVQGSIIEVSAMAAPFIKGGLGVDFHTRMAELLAWFMSHDFQLENGMIIRVMQWRFSIQNPQYAWPVKFVAHQVEMEKVGVVTTRLVNEERVLFTATRFPVVASWVL